MPCRLLVASLATSVLLASASLQAEGPPATQPTTAPSSNTAEAMLAAINAIKRPTFDPSRRGDNAYIEAYSAQVREAIASQNKLRHDFIVAYPAHEQAGAQAAALLQGLANVGSPVGPALDELLALPLSAKAKFAARSMALQMEIMNGGADTKAVLAKIDALKAEQPTEPTIGMLMFRLAQAMEGPDANALLRKVVAGYPDTPWSKMAAGALRSVDSVGKPFELAFDDAVTGKHIDVQKDLKGKVVVIDFWATWCGPCVAEMPDMKKLYAQFKPQGVEFVGVSLDQPEDKGGKQKLLNFVAKHEIGWPQYYQGNYWQSEFSSGWGINSIPAVFVVGPDGTLVNVRARGQLEDVLPKLIAARDNK